MTSSDGLYFTDRGSGPPLVRVLGPKRFAKLAVSQGAKELGKERADWLAGLMGDQGRILMVSAWKETMSFDSRKRLAEIACPTLVVAGSKDQAVPMHHAQRTWVLITESPEGGWGINGHANTGADIIAAARSALARG